MNDANELLERAYKELELPVPNMNVNIEDAMYDLKEIILNRYETVIPSTVQKNNFNHLLDSLEEKEEAFFNGPENNNSRAIYLKEYLIILLDMIEIITHAVPAAPAAPAAPAENRPTTIKWANWASNKPLATTRLIPARGNDNFVGGKRSGSKRKGIRKMRKSTYRRKRANGSKAPTKRGRRS